MKISTTILLLLLLSGCSQKPDPEAIFTKAMDLLLEGKPEEAVDYFHPSYIKSHHTTFTHPEDLTEKETTARRPTILTTVIENDTAMIAVELTNLKGEKEILIAELKAISDSWKITKID